MYNVFDRELAVLTPVIKHALIIINVYVLNLTWNKEYQNLWLPILIVVLTDKLQLLFVVFLYFLLLITFGNIAVRYTGNWYDCPAILSTYTVLTCFNEFEVDTYIFLSLLCRKFTTACYSLRIYMHLYYCSRSLSS